jgi:YggT family protein
MQLMAAFIFLLRTLAGLYIAILLLRMLFQWVRADFYNPVSQAIVKLTSPLVLPLRRVLPAMGRIDTSSLLLALAFQLLLVSVVALLEFGRLSVTQLLLWSILDLLHLLLEIYTFSLFFVVVLSWVSPYNRHPVALLAYQLTEPLLRPVRGKIPPLAGLDFSVMIVLMLIYMLDNYLIPSAPF